MTFSQLIGPKTFPTIQIVISLCAALGYFWTGDIRRGIYWIAAGILTATVTY